MRAVVGLGNPGAEYEYTRHNVGFAVVDELARRWHSPLLLSSINLLGYASFHGLPIALVEPQMFMNRSGDALTHLRGAVRVLDIIAVHDDLDLDLGVVRVKQAGGSAGHRGLKSIAQHFGERFARIRIGIGRPSHRDEVVNYVLGSFGPQQARIVSAAIQDAADAIECLLQNGVATAMNRFNARSPIDINNTAMLTGRN